jgi:hypothetical protein
MRLRGSLFALSAATDLHSTTTLHWGKSMYDREVRRKLQSCFEVVEPQLLPAAHVKAMYEAQANVAIWWHRLGRQWASLSSY